MDEAEEQVSSRIGGQGVGADSSPSCPERCGVRTSSSDHGRRGTLSEPDGHHGEQCRGVRLTTSTRPAARRPPGAARRRARRRRPARLAAAAPVRSRRHRHRLAGGSRRTSPAMTPAGRGARCRAAGPGDRSTDASLGPFGEGKDIGDLVDLGDRSRPRIVDEVCDVAWPPIGRDSRRPATAPRRSSSSRDLGDGRTRSRRRRRHRAAGLAFPDLETAADEVRAEASRRAATRRRSASPRSCPSRSVGPQAEAEARVAADPLFARLGHPAEIGIFGTLEECQDRVIALAHAGITDLRCLLPGDARRARRHRPADRGHPRHDRRADPGLLRSPAPPPPEGWGGRPTSADPEGQWRVQAALMRRAVSTTSGRNSERSAAGVDPPRVGADGQRGADAAVGVHDRRRHRAQTLLELLVDDRPALRADLIEDDRSSASSTTVRSV